MPSHAEASRRRREAKAGYFISVNSPPQQQRCACGPSLFDALFVTLISQPQPGFAQR
jgi:hypothetical protein